MKITVIGAAGVRTPLLVRGLAEVAGQIGLEEIALFDIAGDRLALVARVAQAVARDRGLGASLHAARSAPEAIEGAEVVITSVRVGGIQARVQDERIALAHGLIGQETVGAGGLACALRNLTAMMEYARLVDRVAPHATIVNFTNPVGIVSQALYQVAAARVLGVCDTPLELFESISQVLGRCPAELDFDYLGLNHLGWVRAIRARDGGADVLPSLLRSPEQIRRCYRYGLFPAELIRRLGVLPSEYLYYYYRPEAALASIRASGVSRGETIERLNAKLFGQLAAADGGELLAIYENYLRERNATYFSIEATAGAERDDARPLYSQFSGYERIAVAVLAALASAHPQVIPLTVLNDGALADLESSDSVEVPCQVSASGVVPTRPGQAPETVRELLVRVKEYERLAARAAITRSPAAALAALRKNPLVGEARVAEQVLADYRAAFGSQLGLDAEVPAAGRP